MVGGWQDAIVRILHSAGLEAAGNRVDLPTNAAIVGTGALFRTPQQGLCVLTAAHVVNAALGWNAYATTQPEDDTIIYFDVPAMRQEWGRRYPTRLIVWAPPRSPTTRVSNPVSDIALLQILDTEDGANQRMFGDLRVLQPEDFQVIVDADLEGLLLKGFGFLRPDGAFAEGEIRGAAASGWLHLVATNDKGDFIAPGFSGAPMFDEAKQRILGMAIAIDTDEDKRLAFLQSTLNIWKACPELARPYPGLRAFEERDAPFFYGRDAFVARMLEKTGSCPLLGVTAASGSGKSSAIRAGLIPKLRASNQSLLLIMRPLNDPWKQLALAITRLANPDANILNIDDEADQRAGLLRENPQKLLDYVQALLSSLNAERLTIFVDQFEELFTLGGHDRDQPSEERDKEAEKSNAQPDPARATAPDFRDLMASTARLTGAPQVQWVYALRGDFFGKAFKHRAFADAVSDGNVTLADMTKDELYDAIGRPAAALGVKFEVGAATQAGLIARIAQDAGAAAGALPLMQHVLDQLWREMQDRQLTHAAYDRLGGLKGALNLHADHVFEALSENEQHTARRLFSHLVNVEEDGAATRRVVSREDLQKQQQETMWSLAQKLAGEGSRLLTLNSEGESKTPQSTVTETVEVAHEALLRDWKKLRDWIGEDGRFLSWRRRLGQQLDDHKIAQVKSGTWLTGGPLQIALSWRGFRKDDLGQEELTYIDASEQLEIRETTQKAELTERDRRRYRQLIAALGLIVVVSISAAIYTRGLWIEAQEALIGKEQERKRAFKSKAMLVENIADREIKEGNPGTAIALTLEYITSPERNQDQIIFELMRPLYAGMINNREQEPFIHTDEVLGFSISDDEKTLVSTTKGGGICIWDVERKLVRTAFSKQGRKSEVADAHICNITRRDNQPASELSLALNSVQEPIAEISPDGSYIAYAFEKHLTILEVSKLIEVKSIDTTNSILSLSFGPRSNELFYASGGGGVKLTGIVLDRTRGWTEKALPPISKCEGGGDVLWSQDQSIIFLDSQPVQCIWNRIIPKTNTFDVEPESDFSASMSANGSLAVSSLALNNNRINIIDPISGKVKAQAKVLGKNEDLDDVTIAPDGKTVAIVEDQGMLSLWDITKKQKTRLDVTASFGSTVAFSNSSQLMIRIIGDQIDVWRMRDNEKIAVLGGHGSNFGEVIIGPRDDKIFAVSDDSIRVFSLQQNNEFHRTYLGHFGPAETEFITKDNIVISSDWTPTIRSFEAMSGVERYNLPMALGDEVIFDKANSIYLVHDKNIEIISKLNFNNKVVIPFNRKIMHIGVDPAGRWLAVTDEDGGIYRWSKPSGLKEIGSGARGMMGDIIVSPSGDKFAVMQRDGNVAFFSLTGVPIISPKRINQSNEPSNLVVWEPKGKKVVVSTLYGIKDNDIDRESSLQIWNLDSETGSDWFKSPNLPSLVNSIAWHPNEPIVAIGLKNGSVAVWDVANNTIKSIRREHADFVRELQWSPNGKWLVSDDYSTTVVRDWQSGELLDVKSRLISSNRGGNQEPEDSNPATRNNGGSVKSVAFSPNSRFLSTISDNGVTIELIDISSRNLIAKFNTEEEPLDGHDAPEATVKFSDDGKWLISTHVGKSVQIWRVWEDLGELQQDACRVWYWPLTRTERKRLNLTPDSIIACQHKQPN